MQKSNIALIGMMGSGKSFSSKRLGELLKREVVSTDQLIEEKEKKAVSQIFTDSGEIYFRDIEKAVVKEIAAKHGAILDCGGGIVLNKENIDILKKDAVVFYLSATPEFLLKQVKLSGKIKRPLLNVPDPLAKLKSILLARGPLYEQAADHIIDADNKTIEQICQDILAIIQEGKK